MITRWWPIRQANRGCRSVAKIWGQDPGQSGQAIKLLQVSPYVNDFQTLKQLQEIPFSIPFILYVFLVLFTTYTLHKRISKRKSKPSCYFIQFMQIFVHKIKHFQAVKTYGDPSFPALLLFSHIGTRSLKRNPLANMKWNFDRQNTILNDQNQRHQNSEGKVLKFSKVQQHFLCKSITIFKQ